LLGCIFVKSNPEHVHQDPCMSEGDFRSHVLRDAGRGMQRDRFPNQIGLGLRDAMAPEKSRAASAPSTSNRFMSVWYASTRSRS
jgi:hypothetical protein